MYLESLPLTCTYSELMFLLSEKVQNTVTVKYQIPGEELDPDQLISVCDDGDLQVKKPPRIPSAGHRAQRSQAPTLYYSCNGIKGAVLVDRGVFHEREGGGGRPREGCCCCWIPLLRFHPSLALNEAPLLCLQEMYDEYVQGLSRPGTPAKTFRLRIFLIQAEEQVFVPKGSRRSSANGHEADLR